MAPPRKRLATCWQMIVVIESILCVLGDEKIVFPFLGRKLLALLKMTSIYSLPVIIFYAKKKIIWQLFMVFWYWLKITLVKYQKQRHVSIANNSEATFTETYLI
ncbi:hypothetical protein K501DRAFT_273753 [Backusella circina FSU 941]|nr:hypothetical protein K501DRAFT_273753 [Backusella circina FSU 941]